MNLKLPIALGVVFLGVAEATTSACTSAQATNNKLENEGTAFNHCASEYWLWHIGQLFILLGYCFGGLSTAHNIHRYKTMGAFRFFIAFGNLLLIIWAAAVANAMDHLTYAIIFFILNVVHLTWLLLWDKPITLNPYLHNLWHKMFDQNGYNLELIDFYNLMQEKAFLKTYKSGQTYINEHDRPCQLSILLSGKMSVHKRDDFQRKSLVMSHEGLHNERAVEARKGEQAYCGTVYPYEFIDSYEWLAEQGVSILPAGSGTAQEVTSQVTIKVAAGEEECIVLTWKKEHLDSIFKEHPRLRTCIHALVGKDIAEKMLRITGHSTEELQPDVDMVRKQHGFYTKRADVKVNQTEIERKVYPNMSSRAITIFDDEYRIKQDGQEEPKRISNLTDVQDHVKRVLGAGPWCDLPDEELNSSPWTAHLTKVSNKQLGQWFVPAEKNGDGTVKEGSFPRKDLRLVRFQRANPGDDGHGPVDLDQYMAEAQQDPNGETTIVGVPAEEIDVHHHLLNQAKHSLQRARLRVANARLLALNPAPLESLQPSSDASHHSQKFGSELLEYFERVMSELPKKDLHEILKWGKWRTYYRPGTVLQRQGEEANYIGLVLQGRLAAYTEDELTRSKQLVHNIDRYNLVGSEDFSSKFRTARRTIQMPVYTVPVDPTAVKVAGVELAAGDEEDHAQAPMQELQQDLGDDARRGLPGETAMIFSKERCVMYEMMTVAKARDYAGAGEIPQPHILEDDKKDILERCEAAEKEDGEHAQVLITKIPTVLFVWDIKDLKRLMLADPHVESCLSNLLRGDITYKLDNAHEDALGTRICGMHTTARGDQEVRLCNVSAT
jgi:CRP-like cAMP-binding protein